MENPSLTPPTKEALSHSTETWVSLSPATQESTNQFLADQGMSMYEAQEAIRIDPDRIHQVNAAIVAALNTITAKHIQVTQELRSLPIGTATISLKGDNVAVIIVREKGSRDDEYASSRAALLENTDNLLKVFDKPPLPTYTSQDREEI